VANQKGCGLLSKSIQFHNISFFLEKGLL